MLRLPPHRRDRTGDAFADGYRWGVEHAILATDDLLEPCILAIALLDRVGQPDVADEMNALVTATMRRLKRLRDDEGEQEALDLYRLERG